MEEQGVETQVSNIPSLGMEQNSPDESDDNADEEPINNNQNLEDEEKENLVDISLDSAKPPESSTSLHLTETSEWTSSLYDLQLWCQDKRKRNRFLSEVIHAYGHDEVEWVRAAKKKLINFFNKVRDQKDAPNDFVLLAVKEGNAKMLKFFLDFKKYNIKIKFVKKEASLSTDSVEILNDKSNESVNLCDIEALTNEDKNILHLLFQRPHFKEKSGAPVKGLLRYKWCSIILLDSNHGLEKGVLHKLVNQQDAYGNTPLHYALKSWSQKTVSRLLESGANIGIQNNEKEDPLTNMTSKCLKDYLDTKCIELNDYNLETKNIISEYEDALKDKVERVCDVLKDTEPLLNEKIQSTDAVVFDYNFLALNGNSDMREFHKNSKSSRKQVYEVDVLQKLSEKDDTLLLHPVLRFFIWIKWSRIRPYVIRKLALQFLFCLCATWFLLIKYDINKHIDHCFFHVLNVPFTYLIGTDKCGNANRSSDVSFRSLIFKDNVTKDFQHLPGCRENQNSAMEIYKSCFQYCSLGYFIFIAQFLIQIYIMLKNYKFFKIARFMFEWMNAEKKSKPKPLNRSGKLISKLSVFPCIMIDIFNLTIQLLIMIGGRCQLTLVLQIFLPCVLAFRLSKTTYWIFLNSKPLCQKKEPILYHSFESLHVVLIIDLFFGGITDSSISRGLTAILLFFLWYDFLSDVVIYASYSTFIKPFKMYMMKFTQVTKSFLKVLFAYGIFFFVFGLGFYIVFQPQMIRKMKHEDSNKNVTDQSTSNDKEPNVFESRLSSIVKTFVMFIGEFDFSDLPIGHTDTDSRGRHERMGVLLAYAYFILFIFIVVIVLMNLLNAIAIQDAKEIAKKAEFLEEENRVDVLVYFGYWNRLVLSLVRKLPNCCKFDRIENSLLRYSNIFHVTAEKDYLNYKGDPVTNIGKRVHLANDLSNTSCNNECIKIKAGGDDTLKQILKEAQEKLVQTYRNSFKERNDIKE